MSMINYKILLKRLIKNLNVSHDECEKSQYICKGLTDFHKNWHDNTDCVCEVRGNISHKHTHTHTRLTALFPGLPGWAGTRKVKPIWILLKQETVSGSGISWAICKSASRSGQITTPVPHHSSFLQAGCWDALRAAQPTASTHWRHCMAIFQL